LERFSARIRDAREFALCHRVLLIETREGVPTNISMGIPGYEEEALERSVWVDFPEVGKLRLIGPEDLIIHKCVSGRARDVEDVEGILIHQRLDLDVTLIRNWLQAFCSVVETHDPLVIFEKALNRAPKSPGERGKVSMNEGSL